MVGQHVVTQLTRAL